MRDFVGAEAVSDQMEANGSLLVTTDVGAAEARRFFKSFYRLFIKRLIDISAVLVTVPVVLPIVLFLAAVVSIDGHNPFYSQLRVGQNGRVFRMWKLRSMVKDADALLASHLAKDQAMDREWQKHQKLKNDPRITAVGRFLRKSSLDELPQLWNVLSGDMSLVGPRPIMLEQREIYPGKAYYRLRPGITGNWQVSGRNQTSFQDRAKFDADYLRHLSLKSDVVILLKTIPAVVRGTGH